MHGGLARAVLLPCVLCMLWAQAALALDPNANHKKWIIITSVSYPTDSIKVLAKMPGWKVGS